MIENLLEQMDGRLTAVVVRYPDTRPFIWSLQKHIQFALKHPREAKLEKLIKKSRAWLNEMMWKHPLFRPEFSAIVSLIDTFEGKRPES
jgi:hypothetical protein